MLRTIHLVSDSNSRSRLIQIPCSIEERVESCNWERAAFQRGSRRIELCRSIESNAFEERSRDSVEGYFERRWLMTLTYLRDIQLFSRDSILWSDLLVQSFSEIEKHIPILFQAQSPCLSTLSCPNFPDGTYRNETSPQSPASRPVRWFKTRPAS